MRLAVILLCAAIAGSIAPAKAASGEATFAFSADPAIADRQRAAYDVVHQYEQYLNAADTERILTCLRRRAWPSGTTSPPS